MEKEKETELKVSERSRSLGITAAEEKGKYLARLNRLRRKGFVIGSIRKGKKNVCKEVKFVTWEMSGKGGMTCVDRG